VLILSTKVTAIIPTINRSSLARAIDSALKQTDVEIKILLIDDSEKQEIKFEHPSVRIIKTGGLRGVSYARNLGLNNSTGEFVGFLDDDDFWMPDKSLNQIKEMQTTGIKISITSANVRSNSKSKIRPKKLLNPSSSPLENIYQKHYPFGNVKYLPMAGVLITSDLAKSFQFDENLLERENLDYLQKIYNSGFTIKQIPLIGVQINFNYSSSLSRINYETELQWMEHINCISSNLANNFCLESARNFIRVGNKESAEKMLDEISAPNFRQNIFKFCYKLLTK